MTTNGFFLWFSQHAMLSFPELELRKKKEGEEEQEKGMTAAAAAAVAGETELADSQPQGEGRKDEEEGGDEGRAKVGGGGWEGCQQSEGKQGGEGTPPEDTAEAPRGKRIYRRVCRMQAHAHTHTYRAQKRQSKLCMCEICVCVCIYCTSI